MIDVVLSGPGKNALSTVLMQSVREQLDRAGGRPVLLRGEGDSFSAGLNFLELATLEADGIGGFLTVLEDLLHELYNYPGPTVALVNGHAIAGGCLVAMCCDHRVAADAARLKIGLNEVALGLVFPKPALALARKRVPAQHLDEVILGARLYSPQEAVRVGLVDEVAAAAEAVARKRLTELAGHPAEAYAAAKRAIREGVFDVDAAQRQAERDALLPVWTSQGLRERIAGFLMAKVKSQ